MALQPKQQLTIILTSTGLSIFSLLGILFFSEPSSAGMGGFIVLYTSVFIAVLGIATGAGLGFRRKWFPSIYIKDLTASFRQAFFVALLAVSLLLLQSQSLLYWWVSAPLLLLFFFLEIFLHLES